MRLQLRNSTLWPFFPKLMWRQFMFERMIARLRKEVDLDKRMAIAQAAANKAVASMGYFSSMDIEQVYLDAASRIPEVKCHPKNESYLHVITASSPTGGHAGVLGRWIEAAPHNQRHSIIVLDQYSNTPFPQRLQELPLKHSGEYIEFHEPDLLKRAYKLRQLAAVYSKIIIYTNNSDPTPIVAFGTTSFTNPIIYFNHADHLFWLGISIADIVADISYNDYSTTRRKAHESFFLGIPPIPQEKGPDLVNAETKKMLRRELGIPDDEFVIVSCGRPLKYKPVNVNSFAKQLISLANNEHISSFVIGPDASMPEWGMAQEQSGGRVHPLGLITDKALYEKYLQAADLYVGSYPLAGFTALMDGVQHGLPFIQLLISKQAKFGIDNSNQEGETFCYSHQMLEAKIILAKHNPEYYNTLWQESLKLYSTSCDYRAWLQRLGRLYKKCPLRHGIYSFTHQQGESTYIDDYVAMNAMALGVRYRIKLFGWLCYHFIHY